jgi:two-component system sensor histidine kinase BaeS
MHFGLRGKIILITVATPLILGIATMVTVHRSVREHVDGSSIHESLDHSVLVLEHMLSARARALAGGAQVIARDPRFFSLVTLGEYQRDRHFIDTMRGMAEDFNRFTELEVFEVIDRRGRTLASVGEVKTQAGARDSLVTEGRAGRNASAVVMIGGNQYQLSATPIRADRRIVGVLLLGSEIGATLARELRAQMRSEVTFLADGAITASTLPENRDRGGLLEAIAAADQSEPLESRGAFKVHGQELTYVTVVRRIPGSGTAHEQLYAMQRAFDPELVFLRQTQGDLGLLAVLALMAALVTGAFLSGQIRRPIQQLVTAAQEIQKGNYAHPLNVNSRDEIGFLAQRFDEMRRREEVYVSGLEETMRIKSDFINVASHELRTPISVIAGYQALLESGQLGPLEARQAQALQAIGGCIEKLTRVADQATSMADIRNQRLQPQLESQSLEPLIGRAIGSAVASASSRKIEIVKRLDARLGRVEVDAPLIEQALMHLISNAIRFTPDGGKVEIELRSQTGFAEIDIGDNGPGIPQADISKLFDHGYSVRSSMHHASADGAKAPASGLGLGLGITRGIIEAHGGTIEAGNRPEGGARFTIRLPLGARAKKAA